MESWHIFIFGVLFVNAVVGHRNTKQETKRLLDGLDSNLMHQLQLKIQNLESTVSQLQQTVQSKSDIGFHAELSNQLENLPHDTVVVFDKVITNDGGAYDGSSGVFTCPEDGLYSFAWTTLTNPGHIFHTQFTVDGRGISSSHNNASNMQDGKTATKNVVVHLKRGNRVWIKTIQSYGHVLHADWSSFSGFKV